MKKYYLNYVSRLNPIGCRSISVQKERIEEFICSSHFQEILEQFERVELFSTDDESEPVLTFRKTE